LLQYEDLEANKVIDFSLILRPTITKLNDSVNEMTPVTFVK